MSLKILFMGTPEFSVPILESIHKSNHKLLAVYTQPPTKKSRGQKIIESPVHIISKKLNIDVRCPNNLNNDEEFNFIKNLAPNIVVVAAYGQIIKNFFLDIPNITFINVHASLLPRWRGAAPIQRCMMEMDKETGITIMKIIPKLDAGPYMLQEKIKISNNISQEVLTKQLAILGGKMIIKSLDLIEVHKEKFENQNENKVTYAKKIQKYEAEIKWNIPAKNLAAKINGLSPFPGAWFKHKKIRIKIIKAEEINLDGKIGEVLKDDLTIGCSKNAIRIISLQKEGKKNISAKEFLSGYSIKKGEFLN